MTREEIAELLRAFHASAFARMELGHGEFSVVASRAAGTPLRVSAPLLGFLHARVPPGAQVHADTPIGVIRVLDDESEVEAGVAGTLLDVLVGDGELVEFGQPLAHVATGSAS